MKQGWLISALAVSAICASPPTRADDINDLVGSYTSTETTLVTIKRLTFSKDKDGRMVISGSLVGFPDEVSIGETIGERSAPYPNKKYPDTVLAKFSSQKFKPWIIITYPNSKNLTYTCFMKDADGTSIHFGGALSKD